MWPTQGTFLVGDDRGVISLIDAASGKVLQAFPRAPQLRPARERAGPGVSYDEKRPLRLEHPQRLAAEMVLAGDGSRVAHLPQGGRHAYVWNLRSGVLELVLPRAQPLAFLGRHHDRLAVIGRSADHLPEFAIWSVATGRQGFGRPILLPEARVTGLPLASARYAAFAVDQRELWLWDDEKKSLRRLELPRDYFISPPFSTSPPALISPDGKQLLVSGGADRPQSGGAGPGAREMVVFDTASGKRLRTYPLERGNPPDALGWTLGGGYIVAHQPPDMLLFDARTGAIAHRWRYRPAIELSIERKMLRDPRLDVRVHEPIRDAPYLSPYGDRLALVDPHGHSIAMWDVRLVPPKRVDDLCGGGRCGERFGAFAFPWFSPDGRAIMVQTDARRLWRVDTYSGAVREVPLDVHDIASRIRRLELPALTPQTCYADTQACVETAHAIYMRSTDCTPRDPEAYTCRLRKEALPWMKAACVERGGTFCQTLERLAKTLGDERLQRIGFAGHCALTSKSCGSAGEALGAEEADALAAECRQDVKFCSLAATVVANSPGGAKRAAELARHGCDAGVRKACMVGGFYEQACFMKEDKDCLEGMRAASTGKKPPARAKLAAPARRPELCDQFARGRFIGVRYFEAGEFAGIKVRALRPQGRDGWPFGEGDILVNTIRCKPEHCSAEHFVREVNRLCRTDRDRLLHDLVVEVRSADPKRSRAYLLREAQ